MTLTSIYFYFTGHNCPYIWHGGSPKFSKGSCWCGKDNYCLCTPSLAIDAVIEIDKHDGNGEHIVLVKRRDPPSDVFAIPGGFVDVGESVEEAVIREVNEETHLPLGLEKIEQFRVYSDPSRDKRRHTVSVVFRCHGNADDVWKLKKGDDAKSVVLVPLLEVLDLNLAFDHKQILADYIKTYYPKAALHYSLKNRE